MRQTGDQGTGHGRTVAQVAGWLASSRRLAVGSSSAGVNSIRIIEVDTYRLMPRSLFAQMSVARARSSHLVDLCQSTQIFDCQSALMVPLL